MCGIYFSASQKAQNIPQFFQKFLAVQKFSFLGPNQTCVCLNGDEVDEVVENDRKLRTKLTKSDKRKLDQLPELRRLQLELVRAKNAKNVPLTADLQSELENLQNLELSPDAEYSAEQTLKAVMARGPDFSSVLSFELNETHFLLLSSVLSLRQPYTEQPMANEEIVLQYNGELYGQNCLTGNDTLFLFKRVSDALSLVHGDRRNDAILLALSGLDGEYAFVLTDLKAMKVYFGKDVVGKRSLLLCKELDEILIASVLPNKTGDLLECKGGITYCLNLKDFKLEEFQSSRIDLEGINFNGNITAEEISLKVLALHSKLSYACLVRQDTIDPIFHHTGTINIGVLFSGGLDCTVVAALLAQNYINENKRVEIDLLSVGFENPRTEMTPADLPDRKLGVSSWRELSHLFAGTCVSFRFVQVDVSYEEWLCHKPVVTDLIHPTSTEMDLSIAIAFYFACRSRNCKAIELSEQYMETEIGDYTSQAIVLFSGLGADELFGGYSRHEGVFNNVEENGIELSDLYMELNSELANDLDIIYERNLGRDDRAMTNWGKELRYPYLDQLVIEFAFGEIVPNLKVKFEWKDVTTKKGTKRVKVFERKFILRQLARTLGLKIAAEEPKRAIQFGAKTAKMEIGLSKAKGTDSLQSS
ncbi:hypothetical protein PUMCH_000719 [Australozyma saopauloensis]|uniref:Glutamine amidotransferase type-2 domain-containing protein n=1 Tax=Australozyma saopauloensis TaxID=291208 RepID=A0AAX4H4W3_9ASCO|nr:hypothetical protein PUMCH_000719 [[Candida] saopauloensis]